MGEAEQVRALAEEITEEARAAREAPGGGIELFFNADALELVARALTVYADHIASGGAQ